MKKEYELTHLEPESKSKVLNDDSSDSSACRKQNLLKLITCFYAMVIPMSIWSYLNANYTNKYGKRKLGYVISLLSPEL